MEKHKEKKVKKEMKQKRMEKKKVHEVPAKRIADYGKKK